MSDQISNSEIADFCLVILCLRLGRYLDKPLSPHLPLDIMGYKEFLRKKMTLIVYLTYTDHLTISGGKSLKKVSHVRRRPPVTRNVTARARASGTLLSFVWSISLT